MSSFILNFVLNTHMYICNVPNCISNSEANISENPPFKEKKMLHVHNVNFSLQNPFH